jgi:hypothetical protein
VESAKVKKQATRSIGLEQPTQKTQRFGSLKWRGFSRAEVRCFAAVLAAEGKNPLSG